MSKTISTIELSSTTLDLTERTDGFWLYDETRGMNLSMRAKSSTAALVEALEYYQDRLIEVEHAFSALQTKVGAFVAQINEEE